MQQTVIQYILSRLYSLGVTDIFGVPGDYAFPVNDAICEDPHLRWIGNCNELNAAYAADGYARIKGFAAVCTAYGVGELSSINGIAGAYAEHLPVFHLVGMPPTTTQQTHLLVHHTLGNGEFDLFFKMTEPVVCARALLTPTNCVAETERLITAALYHRRPVYMGIPKDYAHVPIQGTALPEPAPQSDPSALETAVNMIVDALAQARTACLLSGILISRLDLYNEALAVLDASGLPFATMLMDKSVFDETHPSYIGMYWGQFGDPEIRDFVEGCDCILNLGALLTDVNTAGAFTKYLSPSKTIEVMPHQVRLGSTVFEHVEMKDVLLALARRLPRRMETSRPKVKGLEVPQVSREDPLSADYLYSQWGQFFRPRDNIVVETGTPSIGLMSAHQPTGATFHNQTLWGSIGWATPAAFGAALADPGRRTVLITGEGSHQMTAQEISLFPYYDLKPIIFVLNNNGYLIERVLSHKPDIAYNNLPPWHYHMLPQALGCTDWFTARVTTCGELDQALERAQTCNTGAYIEVITDTYDLPQAFKTFAWPM